MFSEYTKNILILLRIKQNKRYIIKLVINKDVLIIVIYITQKFKTANAVENYSSTLQEIFVT